MTAFLVLATVTVYLAIGVAVGWIFSRKTYDEDTMTIGMAVVAWPLVLMFATIYCLGRLAGGRK